MPTGIGDELLWLCPSLDDAGNGTATLNDLSTGGTADASLILLDTAAAWIADTTDGGVRALLTDGVDGYALATPDLSAIIAGTWSLSLWLYYVTDFRTYLTFGDASASSPYLRIQSVPSALQIELDGANEGGGYQAISLLSLSPSTWYHLDIEHGSGGWAIRVDDSPVTPQLESMSEPLGTQFTFPASSLDQLSLGAFVRNTPSAYGVGRFDDLRLFDRALTTTERTNLASMRGHQGGDPTLGRIAETDTPRTIIATENSGALGRPFETETLRPLTTTAAGDLGRIAETDTPRAITATETVTLGRIAESDTMRAVSLIDGIALGRIAEPDTLRTLGITADADAFLNRTSETETARPLETFDGHVREPGRIGETESVRPLSTSSADSVTLGRASETDSARATTLKTQSLIPAYYRYLTA